jgi:hypothetical protein
MWNTQTAKVQTMLGFYWFNAILTTSKHYVMNLDYSLGNLALLFF